jgi:hypothetical protein
MIINLRILKSSAQKTASYYVILIIFLSICGSNSSWGKFPLYHTELGIGSLTIKPLGQFAQKQRLIGTGMTIYGFYGLYKYRNTDFMVGLGFSEHCYDSASEEIPALEKGKWIIKTYEQNSALRTGYLIARIERRRHTFQTYFDIYFLGGINSYINTHITKKNDKYYSKDKETTIDAGVNFYGFAIGVTVYLWALRDLSKVDDNYSAVPFVDISLGAMIGNRLTYARPKSLSSESGLPVYDKVSSRTDMILFRVSVGSSYFDNAKGRSR